MGIHSLLERMGFVRLRDFGLILTEDRRIVTTRPVLDDGFGAKVVGWEGNDLAAMELHAPAAANVVSLAPKAMPPRAPIAAVRAPAPSIATPIPAPVVVVPIAPAPSPPPVITEAVAIAKPVVAEPVTEPPEMTEDEWEWEIAVARARAETPVAPAPIASLLPPPAIPVAKEPPPSKTPWLDEATAYFAPKPVAANAAPRTIIPVPTLPVAVDPRLVIDDITRQLPIQRHRVARGTNPQPHVSNGNDDTATGVDLRALSMHRR